MSEPLHCFDAVGWVIAMTSALYYVQFQIFVCKFWGLAEPGVICEKNGLIKQK